MQVEAEDGAGVVGGDVEPFGVHREDGEDVAMRSVAGRRGGAAEAGGAIVGDTAQGEGFAVTVHELIDPAPAGQFIAPEEGSRWVAFDVSVANTGTKTLGVNPLFFRLKAADNREYQHTFGGPEPTLGYGDQQPGDTSRGWITFELPADAPLATLTYTPPGARDRVVFRLS